MLKRYILKDFICLDSLHDCETSLVDLIDNRLIFSFDKKGLSEDLMPNGIELYPYNKLQVTYIISNAFEYDCYSSVRHINQKRFLRKKAIQFWTLKKLIIYLREKKTNLRVYGHYFDNSKCIIITELINKHGWQMGNEFDLELLVDEVIYEWTTA